MLRRFGGKTADKISEDLFYSALFGTYNLHDGKVLDAFARDGKLTVSSYVRYLDNSFAQLECWELNKAHQEELLQYTNRVRIGCAYDLARRAWVGHNEFDLIVIDAPQGLHSDFKQEIHAEHHDFYRLALGLLKPEGVIVLNLNRKPYNRDEKGSHGYDEYKEYNYDEWMRRRRVFYGIESSDEEKLIGTYRAIASEEGFRVNSVLALPALPNIGTESYVSIVGLEMAKKSIK